MKAIAFLETIRKLPAAFRNRLRGGYPGEQEHRAEIMFQKEHRHFHGETTKASGTTQTRP